MIKPEKKNDPNSYPLIAFRVSEETKKKITKEIEKLQKKINKTIPEDCKRIRKNKIFEEALRLGMEVMSKQYD